MIIISDIAKAALWVALESSGIDPQQALRVQPGIEGFTLEVDLPSPGDRVISHNDCPVIIIDKVLDSEIKNVLIDLNDGPQGTEVIIRPFPGIHDDVYSIFGQGSNW
jgi:hypothetical protein